MCLAVPARTETLPPGGDGKQLVQIACTSCHGLDKFTGVRLTRDDWRETVDLMVRYGARLNPEDAAVVTDYLARSFPGKPKPPGVVVHGASGPGNIVAAITEWTLPTPGSRPHDPAVAPDGSIWYTGQAGSMLGRLDPATGQFREYPLRAPTATTRWLPYGVGPHGLTADAAGNIWFTAQLAGYIGKLDPKTGETIEYRMPDSSARDPHTPIFDQKGTLWFTLQNSDMVGRINPSTSEVKVVRVPTAASQPYGIAVNSKGVPFFVELTGGRVASIDPDTMAVHEYALPHAGTMPRRIALTSDDVVWYTDYGRGYLGRLDPKTGKAVEWATPSGAGPDSQPYAITAVGRVVWYVETGVSPNMLVRFDPATERFQSWPIPSGGGVVRHMVAASDGTLWLACSGVDKIARVVVKSQGAAAVSGTTGVLGTLAVPGAIVVSLDQVTLPAAAARRALTKMEINAETAEQLVNACVDFATAHNGGASVVVLSPSGYLVHAHRTDGQTPNNIDSALHKAQTALYMRVSTREALNRWNTLESQLVRADMNLYLNPGGFPIVVNDQLIGAIGVGGAPGDEQCGYEALTKVLGPQPPMAPALPFAGIGDQPPAATSGR
jgi:virginiamycin B lyase